jgi:ubiquinone/menaquinone biosynthesis C-methylase UbiE
MKKTLMKRNINQNVVDDFGKEWKSFNQNSLSTSELNNIFENYFLIFPWDTLPDNSVGFDLGCGSGRWAKFVAPRVGKLFCIDPSNEALNVAKLKLNDFNNIIFANNSVDNLDLEDNSMDFGYSLGVLHHIPDTQAGLNSCVEKLKKDAPFLVYLYYKFDNKPLWFRIIWQFSNLIRKVISKSPFTVKYILTQFIAISIYYPLSRLSKVLSLFGFTVENIPLSWYKDKSLYTLRTDSLDRFGTKLEHRYTKSEIIDMMEKAGLYNISFNNKSPYWCSIGYKK